MMGASVLQKELEVESMVSLAVAKATYYAYHELYNIEKPVVQHSLTETMTHVVGCKRHVLT